MLQKDSLGPLHMHALHYAPASTSLLEVSRRFQAANTNGCDAKKMFLALQQHLMTLEGWEVLATGAVVRLTHEEREFMKHAQRAVRVWDETNGGLLRSRLIRCEGRD